ncbi:uncharacterized protein LOC113463862 [Ceratina calcarata]|uniref:Uncharacterized protein LOC113463862 n=1 Tax=Ceratina calcarata TaxID=156304 RepID=A0AAJ7RVR7_9HYME|nr:uncharacterized protein LOC113463862 [Ceratina calcarata]
MDEETMWKDFYHKIVTEKEAKEKEKQEDSEHEARTEIRKMAHFEKLDEQHPYLAIAAARMWQNPETKPVTTARFFWKFAAFNFIHKRVQESDGGFFENLGTLLAEKVRAQEQAEGPLPKKKDEVQEAEEEDDLSEESSIEEPVDALLETDSDRDENEHATNFLAESMGWNVSGNYLLCIL